MSNEENAVKKKKAIYKRWWFWVIVVFLVIGGLGSIGESYIDEEVDADKITAEAEEAVAKEKKEDKAEKKKEEKPKELTLEEKVSSVLGDEVKSVTETPEGISVETVLKDNFTVNMMKDGAHIDVVEVLEKIDDGKTPVIDFVFFSELVDQYGNESEESVMIVSFNRETLDKINYDNFNFDNIPNIADAYWTHPALND